MCVCVYVCVCVRVCVCVCVCVLSHSVMSDFCDTMDCSLPGSFVHGVSQPRILEWGAISFSRASSWPRDQTHISCMPGGFITTEPSGKPHHNRIDHRHLFISFLEMRAPANLAFDKAPFLACTWYRCLAVFLLCPHLVGWGNPGGLRCILFIWTWILLDQRPILMTSCNFDNLHNGLVSKYSYPRDWGFNMWIWGRIQTFSL